MPLVTQVVPALVTITGNFTDHQTLFNDIVRSMNGFTACLGILPAEGDSGGKQLLLSIHVLSSLPVDQDMMTQTVLNLAREKLGDDLSWLTGETEAADDQV